MGSPVAERRRVFPVIKNNPMTKEIEYTDTFKEVADYSTKQILIRNFGKVIVNDNNTETEVPMLCIAEIYDLDESGAMRTEEIDEMSNGKGRVMLSFSLLPHLKYIHPDKQKAVANCAGIDITEITIVDIYEYMGGLRFEPAEQVWFETIDDALEHVMSNKLNNNISVRGQLSGFTMDQYYNRLGETNWDKLYHMMNNTDTDFKALLNRLNDE